MKLVIEIDVAKALPIHTKGEMGDLLERLAHMTRIDGPRVHRYEEVEEQSVDTPTLLATTKNVWTRWEVTDSSGAVVGTARIE